MKPSVSINLSSQPFRKDRPFQVAALAGAVVLGALFVYQVSFGLVERTQRNELQASIDQLEKQHSTLKIEGLKLAGTLRKPENAEAIEYSIFLNGLIVRKSISWTKIFNDLEQVIPHNVRVITVRPQVNLDNQVQLDMTVGATEPPPVIDMVMRLEASSLFGATSVTSWLPPSQSEPLFRYRVNVNYAPKL